MSFPAMSFPARSVPERSVSSRLRPGGCAGVSPGQAARLAAVLIIAACAAGLFASGARSHGEPAPARAVLAAR